MRDDLEKNFRAVLRSGLGRLDLVTREEFEVQEAVLSRTREKLEALQQRLESIERRASTSAVQKRDKTATKKRSKRTGKKSSKKSSKKKSGSG